jgi:hypothetical protein
MAQVVHFHPLKAKIVAGESKMRMKRKIQNLFVAASLFVGALGFGGTAQAITIAGDTNASSPTAIFSLTYAPASFSLDVPVGLGWTSLTDLGTFTLHKCLATSCNDTYGTSGGFDEFSLKITFSAPGTVLASPELFGVDIFGTFGREGNSDEIKNGSSLTIDFDNTVHHLTYSGGPGGSFGGFDVYVDDVAPFGPYTNSGSKFFSEENLARQVTGHIGNLTQEFPTPIPEPSPVSEPSTFLMLFSGLLVLGRSVRKKWFRN